ncbi:MAG: TrkA C-terminal domain-containing protein [Planctomycetes bacterium]|nr:TrkA C-terminal domain-containing protein [Planctomycetota bacterium]
MIAIISLLVTLFLSLLVTRVATMALMLTGLSRESARFQARSAFSGVGYTTSEAESIVNHPVRRRIAMLLMMLGNLGIATVVAAMMVSLLQTGQSERWWLNLLLLAAGLLVLWFLSASRWVERRLNRIISRLLRKFSQMEVRDYVAVLQLQNGFAVTEMLIEPQDWLVDKALRSLRLPDEGILVLGIQRSGAYLGAPTAEMEIRAGDTLILYGRIGRIEELDQRRSGRGGDKAHREAVHEHVELLEEQEELEREVAGEDVAPESANDGRGDGGDAASARKDRMQPEVPTEGR